MQTESARFWRALLIDLSVMTVIGLLLAVLGPFGSFQLPFATRLVYWVGLAWAGYAFYRPIGAVVTGLGPRLDLPPWPLWIATCLVANVPVTLLVFFAGQLPGPFFVPSLQAFVETYPYVLIVGAGITALFNLLETRERPHPPVSGTPAPVADPPPRFIDRLPPALGSDLLALEMEDHYVRAHTPLGSELVLMRMRDAVAELEGIEGAQVHRSWWVARGAVENVRREGRNIRLLLANGIEAPVSRANVKPLKDAGWI